MHVLSVYKDNSYYKVALLSKKGTRFSIELLRTFPLERKEENVKLLYTLRPILNNKSYFTTTSIPNKETIIRRVSLKVNSLKKAEEALPYQIESLMPLISKETEIFALPQASKPQEKNFLTLVTKASSIQNAIEDIQKEGLSVDVVSSVGSSLIRFVKRFYSFHSPLIIFHLGKNEILCSLYIERELHSFKVIPLGTEELMVALKEDIMIKDPQKLEKISTELLLSEVQEDALPKTFHWIQKLQGAIARHLSFFKEQFQLDSFDYICTGYVNTPLKLSSLFEEMLHKMPLSLQNEDHPYTQETLLEYAAPISLALDYLENDKESVQLLKKPSISSKLLRKSLSKLAVLSLLALMLPLLCWGSLEGYRRKKERYLQQTLSKIEREIGIEENYASSIDERIQNLQTLNLKENKLIRQWSSRPLVLPILKSLLSNCPAQIELTNLSYALVSSPQEVTLPQSQKLCVEFSAPNEELARFYYEKLLSQLKEHVIERECELTKLEDYFKITLVVTVEGRKKHERK